MIGVVPIKGVEPADVLEKGLMVLGYLMALGGLVVIADGIRRQSDRRGLGEKQARA